RTLNQAGTRDIHKRAVTYTSHELWDKPTMPITVSQKTLISAICACLLLSGCTKSQANDSEASPRLLENISYIPGSNNPAQTLDLFFPENAKGKLPLIVWIHGGAWLGGDKEPAPIGQFLNHGYAAASINYRLSSESKFPAQIHDCKAAIRFLRANADKYNIDPNRIGVFGLSAGGHLCALMGVTNGEKQFEGNEGITNQSSAVQAVCDWCGPSDLFTIRQQAGNNSELDYSSEKSPVRQLLGGEVNTMKDAARLASPVFFASKGDPPFLIMHGNKDVVVPLKQSEELHEALKKAQVQTTFQVVKDAPHWFLTAENVRRVVEFFDDHLKPMPNTASTQ
ncbi:MAG TPA: alpha/beta hydrolase, partial [Candidatus Obscuribacterales bacterium]